MPHGFKDRPRLAASDIPCVILLQGGLQWTDKFEEAVGSMSLTEGLGTHSSEDLWVCVHWSSFVNAAVLE